MALTFVISGKSFSIYNESNAKMNSAIVEYIEGIEVIKAFGREGVSYENQKENEVLHGISLELKEGTFCALVGPSGGGKSTVAKLIARFFDVTQGEICIGGVNIKEMPLSQLSDFVSYVEQNNFLFRCSILENIRLGNPEASDEEVYAAAQAAQCDEFIKKLPDGYETSAGEAGKRLSGGEKQRIAIARMKTIITIAHGLATIQNADQILVISDGKIAEQGTHEELLKKNGVYKDFIKIREKAEGWKIEEK